MAVGATVIVPISAWLLSLSAKVSNIDGQLEAMTVATAEWSRLNAMSMDDLEAQKDALSDYTVGDYQIMVDLGDKGKMEGGKCQTTGVAEGEKNCYNDSKVTIRKDGETLYTSKLLPLTSQDGTGDKMPVGTILAYNGSLADIPSGWHLCDGTDGTPNLLDNRFLEGAADIGIFKDPGLPNIIGTAGSVIANIHPSGAFGTTGLYAYGTGYQHSNYGLYFDASRCSDIYRNDINTVQPKAYTVMYIIKVK